MPSTGDNGHHLSPLEVSASDRGTLRALNVSPEESDGTNTLRPAFEPFLVVSWNCGGFFRTNGLIKSHYGDFGKYLAKIGASVFCLQETKVLRHNLQNVAEGKQCGAVVDGYKSFWAFNELKGRQSGYNGVAIWVKDELISNTGVRATQEVLKHPLDKEGRCLLLDLGGIAIINVYVPHVDTQEGAPQTQYEATIKKKEEFLHLLQQRIKDLHALQKLVIVCGDFNLTWRPGDCPLSRRWIEVRDGVISEKMRFDELKEKTWMRIADVAKAVRISCPAPSSHVEAKFCNLSEDLIVTSDFTLGGKHIPTGRALLAVNDEPVALLMDVKKYTQDPCDVTLEFGVRLSDFTSLGRPSHFLREQRCVEFLESMLVPEGDLVDTFVQVHPTAEDRFTCWHQLLNLRYSNCGSRLDYIFCDVSIARHLIETPTEHLAGADEHNAGSSKNAAYIAATCNGRWHKAPSKETFGAEAGLSIQQDDMQLNDTQFRMPHTGMIYTPPSYSDHIPVCALFSASALIPGKLHISEKETRQCTPWVSQPGLASFFGRGTKRALQA